MTATIAKAVGYVLGFVLVMALVFAILAGEAALLVWLLHALGVPDTFGFWHGMAALVLVNFLFGWASSRD